MLHFTLVARDRAAFDGIRHARQSWAFRSRDGRLIASAKALARQRAFLPSGPRPALDRDHRGANANDRRFLRSAERTAAAAAEVCAAAETQVVPRACACCRRRSSRRRFSNKTEDYGVFKPSRIAHIGQVSIYVQDIARSRRWYEKLGGLRHSRTCEQEAHPFKQGWRIRCCYMSAGRARRMSGAGRGTRSRGQSQRAVGDEFLSHRIRACRATASKTSLDFAAQAKAGGLSRRIMDRCATTASRRSAMAKPAATSPATSTIPITTMSNSARPWTQSKTIARAMATPRVRRGRDAAIGGRLCSPASADQPGRHDSIRGSLLAICRSSNTVLYFRRLPASGMILHNRTQRTLCEILGGSRSIRHPGGQD